MSKKMDDILVAVYMITYNHENYIARSVNGILSQNTNFKYKLFIGDDKSTDDTSAIIKAILEKNIEKIDYTLNEVNLGASRNAKNILEKCFKSGAKYIAICEGDDYWIDNEKLQKQFNVLEIALEHSFCFHQALRINEVSSLYDVYPNLKANSLNSQDFFSLTTIPVASIFFRNNIKFWFPENHFQGDFLILCKLMSHGEAYFLNEVMSVYRKHPSGMSFNNKSFDYLQKRVECLNIEANSQEFSIDVRKEIKRMLKLHTRELINLYKKQLSISLYLKYQYWLLK